MKWGACGGVVIKALRY